MANSFFYATCRGIVKRTENQSVKVLFVSSEVNPISKTGGLADVSGALPVYLRKSGIDIRVVTPLYGSPETTGCVQSFLCDFEITVGMSAHRARIWEGRLKNSVPVYLAANDEFFNRRYLYGSPSGDYPDNAERFIFFCKASLELCRRAGFIPDIIHCNDWQTGLIPAYLKNSMFQSNARTVFTIHNIAYQGLFSHEKFNITGLPEGCFDINGLEYWGRMNMMKGALVYSDVLNTVSTAYSREIQTPEFGCGLEGVLASRRHDLCGILNGADYEEWDPSRDPYIAAQYDPSTLYRKQECKKDLLAVFDLSLDLVDKPVIGMVSRLAEQKGFDLIAEIMHDMMSMDIGFVLLGIGEKKYNDLFSGIGMRYPGRAGSRITYDSAIAHKIEAGCDLFLMPSRYEPCGLNQFYSLKYGTVPVVRATGGLEDTVVDISCSRYRGNGFKFTAYDAGELLETIRRAVAFYAESEAWSSLVRTCMLCDYSWDTSSKQYCTLYSKALSV